jgi:hypothetical protein
MVSRLDGESSVIDHALTLRMLSSIGGIAQRGHLIEMRRRDRRARGWQSFFCLTVRRYLRLEQSVYDAKASASGRDDRTSIFLFESAFEMPGLFPPFRGKCGAGDFLAEERRDAAGIAS